MPCKKKQKKQKTNLHGLQWKNKIAFTVLPNIATHQKEKEYWRRNKKIIEKKNKEKKWSSRVFFFPFIFSNLILFYKIKDFK